uniref:Putative secreted protein n=1 Tax=Anopheles marajoara TaxID=58244 RepID=A0A2M4CDV3_9DIPT
MTWSSRSVSRLLLRYCVVWSSVKAFCFLDLAHDDRKRDIRASERTSGHVIITPSLEVRVYGTAWPGLWATSKE